jgi:hypothetical protein
VPEPRYATAGERLAGRQLKRETRAGVEHFVTGQHEARWLQSEDFLTGKRQDIARLTYVDVGGHAVVLLCARGGPDEAWAPTWIGRAGQVFEDRAVHADGFELSAKMLAAFAAAREVTTGEALCGHDEETAGA